MNKALMTYGMISSGLKDNRVPEKKQEVGEKERTENVFEVIMV